MLNLPSQAPVMVLPGATLFPQTLLPLHIFEPRYRNMLLWSLERHRMFCVVQMKTGVAEAESAEDFHHIAGIGLVRACVQRADGTSDLVLQGIARVSFTSFIEGQPFRLAELCELASAPSSAPESAAALAELLELCNVLRVTGNALPKKLAEQLSQISDAGLLADVVAHTLLQNGVSRQEILEELNVTRRLRAVIRCLSGEIV